MTFVFGFIFGAVVVGFAVWAHMDRMWALSTELMKNRKLRLDKDCECFVVKHEDLQDMDVFSTLNVWGEQLLRLKKEKGL